MIKIQIKSRWLGSVLFEYEKENNTIKDTLTEAVKKDADLTGADLTGADLTGAYLKGADLKGADLTGADLKGAYLTGADLTGADLKGANDIPYVPYACPSDGAFIGWKKVYNFLIKLEIPEDAKRCSATSLKCRCDKAKVIKITNLDETQEYDSVTNNNYEELTYEVDEMVYPDSFDEDRWNECSHGIHFFINKQDAINY